MATRAKRPSNRKPDKNAKEKEKSTRFLTVFLRDKMVSGFFHISESQMQAAEIPLPKDPPKPKEKKTDQSIGPFQKLQKEFIEKVAVHRSLDNVMILLHSANAQIQFNFSISPVLKKFGQVVQEKDDRRIFSFDVAHAREVIAALRKATSGAQGISQLPRLTLIGLVSEYDVFLHDLILAGMKVQKSAAIPINRSLSLDEISNFKTIEDAQNYLFEKEIDAILHDDHHQQLLAIGKLFNLKIDTNDASVKTFLEICERRNLFTHNAGVVNERYLSKCKQYKIDCERRIGERLTVSRKYFQEAISVTQELSIKLIQFMWRKLLPDEKDAADNSLNAAAFELLVADDYKLAERILDYGINHTGPSSDLIRRMMAVNYANAIRLGGDLARAKKELEKFDWSATNPAFQISVAAVREENEKVIGEIGAAVKGGFLDEDDLRRWPVFKNIRSDKAFQDKFREIFGKDLISVVPLTQEDSASAPKISPGNDQTGAGNSGQTHH